MCTKNKHLCTPPYNFKKCFRRIANFTLLNTTYTTRFRIVWTLYLKVCAHLYMSERLILEHCQIHASSTLFEKSETKSTTRFRIVCARLGTLYITKESFGALLSSHEQCTFRKIINKAEYTIQDRLCAISERFCTLVYGGKGKPFHCSANFKRVTYFSKINKVHYSI